MSVANYLVAFEQSIGYVPSTFKHMKKLDVLGIEGRICPLPNPILNMLASECSDSVVIDHVQSCYQALGVPFGWITSKDGATAKALANRGFVKVVEFDNLALELKDMPQMNSDIRVVDITADNIGIASEVLALSYGDVAMEVATAFLEDNVLHNNGSCYNYMSYLGDKPVGIANMVVLPGNRIAYLGAAGTLPDCRGKGLYLALLNQRLAMAKSLGVELAVMHAKQDTSAPICRKYGFTSYGAHDLYCPPME